MGMSAFGVEDSRLSKADQRQRPASPGRLTLGAVLPGWHGAVAGKKGKKLRAVGNEVGGAVGGSIPGQVAGKLLLRKNPVLGARIGGQVGSTGGAVLGTLRAQRMGHFQREKKH